MPRPVLLLLAAGLSLAVASCGPSYDVEQSQALAIGRAMVAACPLASPDDIAAQARCADRLTQLTILRDAMAEPFLWGQQTRLWDYDFVDVNTTRFNPLVFRRMYLSLFMFTGDVRVEQAGERTIVHLPYVFRSGLDPGEYPYPFWHNPTKWRDYQLATEMHLVFRHGRLEGALRSAVRLLSRPQTTRTWDGNWRWDGGAEPHVTLYSNLFSPTNPHVGRVDAAYRALEDALRPYNCYACHSPDNSQHANPLELFSYPNQALVARHDIRVQLEQNRMPPATSTSAMGVPDATERAELIQLAREFETAADDALAAEAEPDHTGITPPFDAGD